jgi:hypothetical protein
MPPSAPGLAARCFLTTYKVTSAMVTLVENKSLATSSPPLC